MKVKPSVIEMKMSVRYFGDERVKERERERERRESGSSAGDKEKQIKKILNLFVVIKNLLAISYI